MARHSHSLTILLLAIISVVLCVRPSNAKYARASTRSTRNTRTRASTGASTKPNDPNYLNTWYFDGEVAPSINTECLWDQGLTGKGVKVLVLDDSIDFTNPELLHKEYEAASYNYMTDSKNVAPTSSEQWHGTPVAGVIAATHNNAVCGVGVAPGAMIAGRVVIFDDTTVEILRKGLSENLANIDIISNSWGIETCEVDDDGEWDDTYCNLVENVGIESAVKSFATTGRNGKGGTIIFAAGDTGNNDTSDTNLNPAARIPYSITVGGVDENLGHTDTSTEGKSLFITAPSANPNCKVGVVGPTSTYSNGNIMHGCTEQLSGSGASAPIVAGVVALMYEAKSTLTSDDVRQILMHTSRKIDKEDDSWTTNSAGVSHSTKYGFGYLDAAGAVEMTRKWSSCGNYSEQTVGVQTTLCSYYTQYLVGEDIVLPAGRTVNIPFFMKSMGSVIIDSMSVTIDNIANQSVEVALREDQRYCSTTVVSRDNDTSNSTQQMPFTTILDATGNPDLADEYVGTVTLTTYQYSGMSSGGEWTLRLKNNGATNLTIPLSSFKLMARGYPSVLELSSPTVTYQNGSIRSLTVKPYLNDPGSASQDFGRGMRVYIWVDGRNPIPATDGNGNALVVDVIDGEDIVIPWKSSYASLLSSTSNSEMKRVRVLFVDADEEYSPFTFSTCHTVISPIIVVGAGEVLPPTTGPGDEGEEEEDCPPSLPPVTAPEEEVEEECDPPIYVPEEQPPLVEEEEPEYIPPNPILPPDEEETRDGFDINPVGAAKIISLLSALLVAMVM